MSAASLTRLLALTQTQPLPYINSDLKSNPHPNSSLNPQTPMQL